MLLFFFSIIYLYFLIHVMNTKIFIPTTELVLPTATQTNEAKAEIETQLVTAETKKSKCST